MKLQIGLACLALACSTVSPALSQSSFRYDGDGSYRNSPRQSRAAARAPRTCQPLCVADTSPCDPPEYKIADGRCQDPFFFQ